MLFFDTLSPELNIVIARFALSDVRRCKEVLELINVDGELRRGVVDACDTIVETGASVANFNGTERRHEILSLSASGAAVIGSGNSGEGYTRAERWKHWDGLNLSVQPDHDYGMFELLLGALSDSVRVLEIRSAAVSAQFASIISQNSKNIRVLRVRAGYLYISGRDLSLLLESCPHVTNLDLELDCVDSSVLHAATELISKLPLRTLRLSFRYVAVGIRKCFQQLWLACTTAQNISSTFAETQHNDANTLSIEILQHVFSGQNMQLVVRWRER